MKNRVTACLFVAFAVLMIAPPIMVVFYWLWPASNATEQHRVIIYGRILFALLCVVAIRIAHIGYQQRRPFYFIAPVLVFLNPLHQPFWIEPLDDYLNYKLFEKATESKLVGRSMDQVLEIMGKPYAQFGKNGSGQWNYKPLKYYWAGSKLEVFYKDGIVTSIDPNDD